MKKFIVDAIILKNEKIATDTADVFDMTLKSKELSQTAKPGQFLKIYLNNNINILPRPISICEIDKQNENIRIVYKVLGKGTFLFSKMQKGEKLKIVGNCGNGYDISKKGRHILIGGGIGIPPLLETCKQLEGEKIVILGFKEDTFLTKDFAKYADKLFIATEEGTEGFKGNVIDILNKENITVDFIYSCGPEKMLANVAKFAKEKNIHCQVSVEERMACATGACLGCVIKTNVDGKEIYKRVCKEGPVFNSLEVLFNA